ncbi:nucleotidyltransferase family protein [Altericroceibacterium endophyticum]|uniref:NTP transferase domain-containing protein n=1 Tax=Altericroceibacterium endophyticum TaxID=1808508 RepID=A0A6I4T461_9SPHN|nr:nucleotidyltransferase family protein [Altericroceibacterium endophyticum]MXO65548.1 NTP transferase domain-containing protein [Altericroceibacterium endophyticum]
MSFTALVLAGSRGEADRVARYAGVPEKALIEIGGATMLARVVQALRDAGADRIAVSGSTQAVRDHAAALGAEALIAESGPSLSTMAAFEKLGAPLLVTTADHALLRPEWVRQFLADAPDDADVCALLARQEVIEAAVPETQRTYLRFADGAWSGCNMFYLATPKARAAISLWQQIEADRKRPWRLVRRLGAATLLRYIAGRLSLADALGKLGKTAGISAQIVPSDYGLAAVDVDKPADLDLVRTLVANPSR